METKKEPKPMPKWLIYTLFILKFLLGLVLIYWTVYMTLQSDVGKDDDNAFLSNYHHIDDNYNKIIAQNYEFNKKYNIEFKFNDEIVDGLTIDDVYLSQRVIKERKIRKDMLFVGVNNFSVKVTNKNGELVTNKLVKVLVTKNTTHAQDENIELVNQDSQKFKVQSIGYWNITGTVEIDGSKGSFYIKTNATAKAK